MSEFALEARGLGKRYGKKWALRDCTLEIPTGCVAALVGPDGAGKTTLLHLAVGLTDATAGSARVLGRSAREKPEVVLPRLGFVAQEHPLYRRLRIGEMLKAGDQLKPTWAPALVQTRLERPANAARRPCARSSVRLALAGGRGRPGGDRARLSRPEPLRRT